MRVLVVEDDRELAEILRRGLEELLHSVEVANDGETGRHLALTEEFDLVLLDLMLPRVDGVSICTELRARGKLTPVIMLTARDGVDDRILGLDAGADDYVVKPFSMGELFARIRALMRRVENRPESVLRAGELSLDPATDFVLRGDRRIALTAREFALLQYFMQNPGKILSRTLILENVWDSNYEGLSNVVDVYVNSLRNKLEEHGEPRLIATVRGRGYVLQESADET
jgi:DNA-binding response OmpR family regulator